VRCPAPLEQVIATDPAFAPAYGGLANADTRLSIPGAIPFETAYSVMRPAAVKAVQLDPLLAEAHAAMGIVYSYERAWENSEKSFQRAIDLNPTLTQFTVGRYEDAVATFERLRAADPEFPFAKMYLARPLLFGGRLKEALSLFESPRVCQSGAPRGRPEACPYEGLPPIPRRSTMQPWETWIAPLTRWSERPFGSRSVSHFF
jgi:tetratricopeptide (TPR) repeat protein